MSVVPGPELWLTGREFGEPRLAPDGTVVAMTVSWGGRSAIVLVPSTGGPERLLTTSPEPRPGRGGSYTWCPDGSGLVYAAKDGNLWRQPVTGAAPQRLTDLGPDDGPQAPAVSPDGGQLAFVTDLGTLWVVALDGSGAASRVEIAADFVTDPTWGPDGSLAWHEWSVPAMAWDESRIVVRSSTGERRIVGTRGRQAQQPRFGADGRLWCVRDDGGFLNVWCDDRPVVSEPFEHARPTWGAGQRSFALVGDGRVVIARIEQGFGRLVVSDVDGATVTLGRGVHTELDCVGTTVVAVRSGAVTPPQIVAYDLGAGERRVLASGAPIGWDAVSLAEPEPVTWPADDGTELHGRLYRSTAGPAERMFCWLHGGPTDQSTVAFNARYAAWTARGWNVLVPDFRGSVGHGRAYQQALRERWGDLDVLDAAAALRHAHRSGWAWPATTVVTGGSAGGFTALHLVAHHPDLVAGAVVSYPVSDLVALDETTHRFEAHYNATLLGVRPGADARYLERSPVTFAAEIRRPLLVFHGDADPVVGVEQSRELVRRIEAAGGSVELHVYPDEGHGFRNPVHQLDEFRRTESFVAGLPEPPAGGFG